MDGLAKNQSAAGKAILLKDRFSLSVIFTETTLLWQDTFY
jgi:hypothetical protein